MNQDFKIIISELTEKPDIGRKDLFLRSCRTKYQKTRIGSMELLKVQFSYIRLPVWMISVFVLAVAIWGLYQDRNVLIVVSVLIPFVSGIAVFDSFRSRMYGMTDMEAVTRVSMRGILFARIVCVGITHIALLLILALIIGRQSGYGYLMTGAMLTTPYLLSSVGSMEIERTAVGRKNEFSCLMISLLVSALMVLLHSDNNTAYDHRRIWLLALSVLVILECMEIKRMFQREDYVWN